MRLIIGKCNNTDCKHHNDNVCCLPSTLVHEFQYDHDTGLLSCQIFIDSKEDP
jgi:hypothetical protein